VKKPWLCDNFAFLWLWSWGCEGLDTQNTQKLDGRALYRYNKASEDKYMTNEFICDKSRNNQRNKGACAPGEHPMATQGSLSNSFALGKSSFACDGHLSCERGDLTLF